MKLPRVMIASVSSGSGKTVFTCGLLRLLRDMGRDPAPFKCGPDYIDPMFHREVSGADSGNLDPFFSGADELNMLLSSCGRGLAVLEGAMGIYDGIAGEAYRGSCYEAACETGTPVVLLVNAKGMGATILSVIKGVLAGDSEKLVRGIVLSRMSAGFYERLRPLLTDMLEGISRERGAACRLLGAVPDSKDICLGSRHLGLVMPGETDDLEEQTAAAAGLIRDNIDISGLIGIMESAADIEDADAAEDRGQSVYLQMGSGGSAGVSAAGPPEKLLMAVARDEAFCFYYKENLNELIRHGIEPVYFSPLHDRGLPEGSAGLLLGGGYPELHAEELSDNASVLDAVRTAIRSGMPCLAECGGFMYLLESLEADGVSYGMCGVIKGSSHNAGRLGRFGYIDVKGKEPAAGMPRSLISGLTIKGHEFHYYDSDNNGADALAVKPGSGRQWECMHAGESHLWGYPHLWYPSCPELIDRLRSAMLAYRGRAK